MVVILTPIVLMVVGFPGHWFPLIRPAIRTGYFLGGVALGGVGTLRLP